MGVALAKRPTAAFHQETNMSNDQATVFKTYLPLDSLAAQASVSGMAAYNKLCAEA